jgi:hypothetical protein
MQTDNLLPESPVSEREATRERLARQIGRLLAKEWLRNRTATLDKASGAKQRPAPKMPALSD